MRDFEYFSPQTWDEALALGKAGENRFIAGGTLMVDLLRLDVERPSKLVDLNGLLPSTLTWSDRGLTIGAGVRNSALAYEPRVVSELPALSQALLSGASPQLRNMATVGGNLLQRTRCSYFRDTAVDACNKRNPGSGCAAIAGYSRMHAVLGVSEHCIAANPSDMSVALLALDAVIRTRRPQGPRELAMADLHVVPGDHPARETQLETGEIVSEVFVPSSAMARRSAYVKTRDRASYAFALASAAVALELDGDVVKAVRIALGGVATKPWRAVEAEAALVGRPATRKSFEAAARLTTNGAHVTFDNKFKLELLPRVVVRALETAGAGA